MGKSKKYVTDHTLEEEIANYLLRKASVKRPSLEDFSLFSILKHLKNKNFDINEERVKEILRKLKEKGEVEKKYRIYEVYIPVKYEKKFRELKKLPDPALKISIALMTGYILLYFLGSYNMIKKTYILFPLDAPQMMIDGFILPLTLGAISIGIIEFIGKRLMEKVDFFKEMVEFFGGPKIFKYALFFTVLFGVIYIAFSIWLRSEINSYFLTFLLATVFLGVIGLSKKIESKEKK